MNKLLEAKSWAISGILHVVVLGLIITAGSISGQGPSSQVPIGDNRPLVKQSSAGINSVELQNLTPADKSPETIELKAGQLKAFESAKDISWLLFPVSDDAFDGGLAYEEAGGGTVVFAYDVDKGRWGKFKVPDDQMVVLIGCNPDAKGKYLLIKQKVVDNKPVVVARTYLSVAGENKKEEEKKEEEKKEEEKPKPIVTGRKLSTVIIEETADAVAKRYAFFGTDEVKSYYKSKSHSEPVIADKDIKDGLTNQTPEKLKPYVQRAIGKKLPQVYLVDVNTGDVVVEGELQPNTTPAQFIELLKKAGG